MCHMWSFMASIYAYKEPAGDKGIPQMTAVNMCEHCHISRWAAKHHISYFPEIIIKLCLDCHVVIHKSKSPLYDKYKKYNPGDSRLFYDPKHKKKHQTKCWLDLPRTNILDGIAHKLFARCFLGIKTC